MYWHFNIEMTNKVSTVWRLDVVAGLNRLRKGRQYTDISLVYSNKEIHVHKLFISTFIQDISKKTDPFYELPESELSWELFFDFLYNIDYVTIQQFKESILPLAKLLGIKCLCNIKMQILKDEIVLNEYIKNALLNMIFAHLSKSLLSGYLSDTVIRIGNETFKCHKVVLAAVSPFFESMFLSGMLETSATEVPLIDVEKSTFMRVLSFIYSGEDILNSNNIEMMMNMAVYFQIDNLQDKCEKFIVRNMDNDNAIGVYRLGQLCDSIYLSHRAEQVILQNYQSVSKTEEFMSLSLKELSAILKNKSLYIKSNTCLFDSLILWFSTGKRQPMELYTLLSLINLSSVDSTRLSSALRDCRSIKSAPDCQVLIKKALVEIAEGKPSTEVGRKPKTECLVLIRSSGYRQGLFATCFSFESKSWYELSALQTYDAGSGYAACKIGTSIFVSGGSGNLSGFCQYDIDSNKWRNLKHLKSERSEHVSCCVDNGVYVLGGRNHLHAVNNTVDKFDPKSGKWSNIGELRHPVFGASGIAVGKRIFVYGGCISFSEYSNVIQYFDTTTSSSIMLTLLPIQCSFGSITSHEDDIYLIGPRGHVIFYDQDTKPEIIGNIHNSSCMGFSVSKHKNRLLVVGGYGSKTESADIKSFDINTQKTTIVKNMKMPWARESNQYFSTLTYVDEQLLVKEIKECK